MNTKEQQIKDNRSKRQPFGVYVIFLIEALERFSYYGMMCILMKYMYTSNADGGLSMSQLQAFKIKRIFSTCIYFFALIGGLFFNNKFGVLFGMSVTMLGHIIIGIKREAFFLYLGLASITIGCAVLKPSIIGLLAAQYRKTDHTNRNVGFNLFYTALNLGACAGRFVIAYVGEKISYHIALTIGAICMVIGSVAYLLTVKNIQVQSESNNDSGNQQKEKFVGTKIILCFIIAFYNLVYGIVELQSQGTLSIYTDNCVERKIGNFLVPNGWFGNINPLMVVLITPWIRNIKFLNFSTINSCIVSMGLVSSGVLVLLLSTFVTSKFGICGVSWIVGFYVLTTLGEIVSAPQTISFISTYRPEKYAGIFLGMNGATYGVASFISDSIGIAGISKLGYGFVFSMVLLACIITIILLLSVKRYVTKNINIIDSEYIEQETKNIQNNKSINNTESRS